MHIELYLFLVGGFNHLENMKSMGRITVSHIIPKNENHFPNHQPDILPTYHLGNSHDPKTHKTHWPPAPCTKCWWRYLLLIFIFIMVKYIYTIDSLNMMYLSI